MKKPRYWKFSVWSLIGALMSLVVLWSSNNAFAEAALPELPRVYVDSTYPDTSTYTQVAVPAGGDLQAAIDNAACGTVIKLTAGATYTGNFWLKNKNCSDKWIIITTTQESQLPPPGTRVKPSDSVNMAKIVSPNVGAVVSTEFKASHYRLVGLEVTATIPDDYLLNNLIFLYTDSDQESNLPSHMVFDRLYVHGTPTSNFRRGITPNGKHIAVVDSYISEIHQYGFDSQAIACWMCPGPLKILNNHLEGASENVAFGGAYSKVPNVVPSDIEIRGNYFFKPLSWKFDEPEFAGTRWLVKNLFETKCTKRMLFEGNVLENNWLEAQAGFAFVLSPRNRYDGPWCVTDDMLFRNNIIRHSAMGVNLSGVDDVEEGQIIANRIMFTNNVWEDIGGSWGNYGMGYQVLHGPIDFVVDHDTMLQDSSMIGFDGAGLYTANNFTFTNNIIKYNLYGIHSGIASNKAALDKWTANYNFNKNVIYLNKNKITFPDYYWMDSEYGASIFPAGNYFPMFANDIGFTNYNSGIGGNYTLLPTSPYKNAGTDGKDIGADIAAVNLATRGAVSGIWEKIVSLSPTSQSFSASGGTGVIQVTSLTEGGWSAESDVDWITVTSGASGSGNGEVNYSVAANGGAAQRSGTLTIGGEMFTVNQEAVDSAQPSAPTNLQATVISTSQINLSWTPSTDNVAVTGYRIYRNGKEIDTTTGTTYEDTGLRPKTTYKYQVVAYDGSGNVSAKSKAVNMTTQPNKPSTKFTIGDQVQVTGKVGVRSTPSGKGTLLGNQTKRAQGTVMGGPWYANGSWWWQVDFESGDDGWVQAKKLKKQTEH